MRAAQTVFITADRRRAVPEGHKDSKFLLIRTGQEIAQSEAERYEGAVELIGGTKEKNLAQFNEAERLVHRDPHPENRDPKKAKEK